MTDDLIAFIRARLDEDEAAAKACAGAPWVDSGVLGIQVDPVAIRDAKWVFGKMGYVGTIAHDYDRAHIARHDPARVLRAVAAKRAIVAIHEIGVDPCDAHDASFASIHCDTMSALASEWSDHADYRTEWTA